IYTLSLQTLSDLTHFETATQTLGQSWNTFWWLVASDDDLLVVLMKCIKCVEEFFLGLFLVGDELHVVDDKYIDVAVFIGKALFFETNTIQELLHKSFRTYIDDAHVGLIFDNFIANCLRQVGFT